MSFHRFDLAQLPAMPWKNGGGTTREIVCRPEGAGLDDFDWRVSVANIGMPGPFSAFVGVDRQIMLLDGDGVHLRGAGIDHKLDEPYMPFAFSGDVPLDCTMLGGASIDFNVMTRRGCVQAELRIAQAAETLAASAGVLMVLDGAWKMNDASYTQGQGVWWDESTTWQYKPTSGEATLAVLTLHLSPSFPRRRESSVVE
jgi:environmental stress-induced protein Ves